MKTAIITGVSGQDGSYLAEYLLDYSYRVYGLVVGHEDLTNLANVLEHPSFELVDGELLDSTFIHDLIRSIRPDRFFNLAGQSFVPLSWKQPEFTVDFNGTSIVRILEAIRMWSAHTRFYQASSSEMFGNSSNVCLDENTILAPCSPYAAAKALGHHMVRVYRESYGLFACSGILFNHESPRRGKEFVTQKIAMAVARMVHGDTTVLRLGNPNARRDWGYAPDYIRAMTMMLDHETADDYVIATGEAHSVEEFCSEAFRTAGIVDWRPLVQFNDSSLSRPKDVDFMRGNPEKARRILGWRPHANFKDIVHVMVQAAIEAIAQSKEIDIKDFV